VERATIIMEEAVATGLPVWVGFSTKVDKDGVIKIRDEWVIVRDLTFDQVYKAVMALGGSVVAVMHSEVEYIQPTLKDIKARWKGPVGAYPNSGYWERPDWKFDKVVSPEAYLSEAKKWVQMGAQIIGGCCGIGPQHIEVLKKGLPTRIPASAKR